MENIRKCEICGQEISFAEYLSDAEITTCCGKLVCPDCICWAESDESRLICKDCCDCYDSCTESSSIAYSTKYDEYCCGEDFFEYETNFDKFYKKYFKFYNYKWIIIAAMLFILFLIKP